MAAGYQALLGRHLVRPSTMNLWVMRADGIGQAAGHAQPRRLVRAVLHSGRQAALIYSSNWENPHGRNFDLYLVGVEVATRAGDPRPDASTASRCSLRTAAGWSFASNRGAQVQGETNLFLAEWRP